MFELSVTKQNFFPRLEVVFSGAYSAPFSAHIRVASARGAGLARSLEGGADSARIQHLALAPYVHHAPHIFVRR